MAGSIFDRKLMLDIIYNGFNGVLGHVGLDMFQGNELLFANVASKCLLSKSQYSFLASVAEDGKQIVVLFPSGDFLNQEFSTDAEIVQFATAFSKKFVVVARTGVRGKHAHPVIQTLSASAGRVLWNFTKFSVDASGTSITRFLPVSKNSAE